MAQNTPPGRETHKARVLHLVASERFYGAEAVILDLCGALPDEGYLGAIACFRKSPETTPQLGDMAESRGIEVRYILSRSPFSLSSLFTLLRHVREGGFSLLHSHGFKPSFYCFLLSLFFGVPFVVTCHLWVKESRRIRFYNRVEKMAMLFARRIAAVSHAIGDDLAAFRPLKKKVVVIQNGIDTGRYQAAASESSRAGLRSELGLRPGTIIVGTLGRLVFQKAHETMIESCRMILPEFGNVEFVVAGEGHREGELRALAGASGVAGDFHFLGYRRDHAAVLDLIDIFVLTSADEGLPIVLLEAMFMARPVVVTAVGEIPFVVEDGVSGILIRPGDPSALTAALMRLLKDPGARRRLGIAARERLLADFTSRRMAQKYSALYDEVLGGRTGEAAWVPKGTAPVS